MAFEKKPTVQKIEQPEPVAPKQRQTGNRGAESPIVASENQLEFGESMSVEAFKKMHGASKLKVMTNPQTGKLFFSCGGVTGAVSTRATLEELSENPIISEVKAPDDDEPFFLLHVDGGLDADLEL